MAVRPGRQQRRGGLRRRLGDPQGGTAHLLGIAHCVFYSCLMNGSNHLAESDARPLHPCPVDLRKLQHSIGFDVADRYRRLRTFAEDAGLTDEARWARRATAAPRARPRRNLNARP
jgi:archaemetzincin